MRSISFHYLMKLLLIIVVISYGFKVHTQNLVLNGDFEDFSSCPQGLKTLEKSKTLLHVTNPNQGTFDFIHECDEDNYPRYYYGKREPVSGKGFVGIGVFVNNSIGVDNFKEYIQLELSDSLKKGSIYSFEMFLSLAKNWHISINNLGVYFSNEFLQLKTNGVIPVKPDIVSPDFFGNKSGWDKYSGDYIARGGEKYIVIGNFRKNKDVKIKNVDSGPTFENHVYYFIDNVSLKLNTNLSEGIVLNNINFKTGSAELLASSNFELDKIVTVLETNLNFKVEIIGHTDSDGNESENIKLSIDRANQVAKYLIDKGVSATRIKSRGEGSKIPIKDNSTPEGKAKNRRVELRFL